MTSVAWAAKDTLIVDYGNHDMTLNWEFAVVKQDDEGKKTCRVVKRRDYGSVKGSGGKLFWTVKDRDNVAKGDEIKIFTWA